MKAILFILFFAFSVPLLYAKNEKQKQLDFAIKTQDLISGDIHYYFSVLPPSRVAKRFPDVLDLDTLSLLREKDVSIILTKSIFVARKPVGFFDDKQLSAPEYIRHLYSRKRVHQISPAVYTINGNQSFKLKLYFDADDVSTLPGSRVSRAVSGVKKLDVMTLGASTIMVNEFSDFSESILGGTTVSSIIPLKENQTLIITYSLWGKRNPVGNRSSLEADFVKELEAQKRLIESFRDQAASSPQTE
jgi:hypothetical protein